MEQITSPELLSCPHSRQVIGFVSLEIVRLFCDGVGWLLVPVYGTGGGGGVLGNGDSCTPQFWQKVSPGVFCCPQAEQVPAATTRLALSLSFASCLGSVVDCSLKPQFSQNTAPGRFLYWQSGHTFILDSICVVVDYQQP